MIMAKDDRSLRSLGRRTKDAMTEGRGTTAPFGRWDEGRNCSEWCCSFVLRPSSPPANGRPSSLVPLLLCALLLTACASRLERAIAQGDALRGTKDYSGALHAYEQIVAEYHQPKVAEVFLRIGDLYAYNLKQTDQAVAYYRQVTTEWPWDPAALTAYQRLAESAEGSGDFTGSVEALEMLLRYFPSYPDRDRVRHRIGTLYLKLKNYDQAKIEFAELLRSKKLVPDVRAQVLFDLGETYFLNRQPEAAMPYYERFLEDFPLHPLAERVVKQLSACHEDLGQMGESAALGKRATAVVATPHVVNGREETPTAPDAEKNISTTTSVTLITNGKPPTTVTAEIAETLAARAQGLMFREHLAGDHGMWFVFENDTQDSFWMKNTVLSLDIIFVGADHRVVDVIPNTTPRSETPLQPRAKYRYVLEVNAGFAKEHGVGRGTVINAK